MQRQGVRPLRTARGQQQQSQPLGGDLGVRDAPLHQPRRGRVGGALLQTGLDHQRRLVQPRGAVPYVLQGLVDVVRPGVQQVELGLDQLRQAGPEGLPQPLQNARRRRRDDREPHHGTAAEGHGDGRAQPRQRRQGGPDEQGHEIHLERDQPQRVAPVPEAAPVDGAEDQHHEEGVTDDDPRRQQGAQRHRGQRHGQPQGEGDRLGTALLLPDGERGRHRRHRARHQMGDVGPNGASTASVSVIAPTVRSAAISRNRPGSDAATRSRSRVRPERPALLTPPYSLPSAAEIHFSACHAAGGPRGRVTVRAGPTPPRAPAPAPASDRRPCTRSPSAWRACAPGSRCARSRRRRPR